MVSRHSYALSTVSSSNASSNQGRTNRIPGDIVLSVIDHVDLQQLIRMAHVCREWRLLAHSHPTFWRTIDVSSVSHASLECMHTRLQFTDAPIERFALALAVEDPAIESVVLPALAAHLHRIVHLDLNLHRKDADALWHVLRGAAPLMKRLLSADHMTIADHVPLPADILLGGAPPKLALFTGGNIRLPVQPMAVFENVVELMWIADRSVAGNRMILSPRRLSAHFPRVKHLVLDAPSVVMAHKFCDGVLDVQLSSLCVDLKGPAHVSLAYLPPGRPRRPADQSARQRHSRVLGVIQGLGMGASVNLSRYNLLRANHKTHPKFEHSMWCNPSIMELVPPRNSLQHLTLLLNGNNVSWRAAAKIRCPLYSQSYCGANRSPTSSAED